MTVEMRPSDRPLSGIAARKLAAALVGTLRGEFPSALQFDGVDLGPAAEQTLFRLLRKRTNGPVRPGGLVRPAVRLLLVAGASVVPRRLPKLRDQVIAVVFNPAHIEILRPVARELHAQSGRRVLSVSDGMAGNAAGALPRLPTFLKASAWGAVAAKSRDLRTITPVAPNFWRGQVDEESAIRAARALEADLHRHVLAVARFGSLLKERPALIMTFDEIGRRSRLIGPVASRFGVPSLDLPHAEAADPHAIQGAQYDMFGVFGRRAREVLMQAEIPDDKIREIGPARFDALIGRQRAPLASPRRVVFASQWLTGQMTAAVKRDTLQLALLAATSIAPCEVVISPHPLEQDGIAEEVLARTTRPGVKARVERSQSLYELLDGAWVLLTGWSNSVYEGLLADVPAVCISPAGVTAPTSFVEEGIALGAASLEDLRLALERIDAPAERERLLKSARGGLGGHLGPLDGRAAARSAALIMELLDRT